MTDNDRDFDDNIISEEDENILSTGENAASAYCPSESIREDSKTDQNGPHQHVSHLSMTSGKSIKHMDRDEMNREEMDKT